MWKMAQDPKATQAHQTCKIYRPPPLLSSTLQGFNWTTVTYLLQPSFSHFSRMMRVEVY